MSERDTTKRPLDVAVIGVPMDLGTDDMDAVDPRHAPRVGRPLQGSLTVREAHRIMELVADSGALAACEVVEVNPVLDQRNATAELAAGLIHSALGARIL